MIFGRARHPQEGVAENPNSVTGGFQAHGRQELFMFAQGTLVLVIKNTYIVYILLL